MTRGGRRWCTLSGVWAELEQSAGGVGELGKRLGVGRQTIWRWSRGVLPAAVMQKYVNTYARRHGIRPPFGQQINGVVWVDLTGNGHDLVAVAQGSTEAEVQAGLAELAQLGEVAE